MFIRDEFGQWIFVPKGLCFIEGEGAGDEGGGSGEGEGSSEGSEGAGEGAGTGEADAGAGEGAGGSEADAGNQDDDWRAAITDERIKTYAKSFNSPTELAIEAFKARQAASGAIFRPGKNATEEEVAAYRKSIGVPEKAEDYKFDVPEGVAEDDATLSGYKEFAHKHNLSQEQLDANMAWYFEQVTRQEADEEKEFKKAQAEQCRDLEQDWGRDYQANTEFAVRAARGIGGDEFVDFMDTVQVDGVRLGDHPSFLKPWAKVGRLMSESDPLIGMSSEDVQTMRDEHHDLSGKILEANARGDKREADRLTRQRDALNTKFGDGQPVVGSQGRTL